MRGKKTTRYRKKEHDHNKNKQYFLSDDATTFYDGIIIIEVKDVMLYGALLDVCEYWCRYIYKYDDKYYDFKIDVFQEKFLQVENAQGETLVFSKIFARFLRKVGIKSERDFDKKYKKWSRWRKKVERTGKRRLDSEEVHVTK